MRGGGNPTYELEDCLFETVTVTDDDDDDEDDDDDDLAALSFCKVFLFSSMRRFGGVCSC